MTTSETVHDANTLATIICFRARRSTMAPHPSAGPAEPVPPVTADDPYARPVQTPVQLSLFETIPNP
jgi:hypothetical protein